MEQLTKDIQLIELDELFAVRKIRFEGYMLKHFSNGDNVEIDSFRKSIIEQFNAHNYYGMITTVENYVEQSKRFLNKLPDSLTLAFSMITLYKDEQQNQVSDEFHVKKIESMLNDGLLYSNIRDVAINFILRFPADFRALTESAVYLNNLLLKGNEHENIND